MTRDHARDHLLVECAKWHGGVPGLGIVTTHDFDPAEHFAVQLEAFSAVGLLEPDEVMEWRRRFAEAAPPSGLEVDPGLRERGERYLESLRAGDGVDSEAFQAALQVLTALGVLTWGDVTSRLDAFDGDSDEEEWPDIGRGDLRRVVLGPAEEAAGVRIVAVELYPDGLVLRWTANDLPELAIYDDVGTPFEERDAEGDESGGRRVRGTTVFTPAAPDTATRLAIEVGGGRLEMELTP